MARIKPGVPTVKEIREGESEYRYISGTGLVLYTRYNNRLYSTKMHEAPTPPIIDKKLEVAIGDRVSSSLDEGEFIKSDGSVTFTGNQSHGGNDITGVNDLIVSDDVTIGDDLDVDGHTTLDQVTVNTTDGAFAVSGANPISLTTTTADVNITSGQTLDVGIGVDYELDVTRECAWNTAIVDWNNSNAFDLTSVGNITIETSGANTEKKILISNDNVFVSSPAATGFTGIHLKSDSQGTSNVFNGILIECANVAAKGSSYGIDLHSRNNMRLRCEDDNSGGPTSMVVRATGPIDIGVADSLAVQTITSHVKIHGVSEVETLYRQASTGTKHTDTHYYINTSTHDVKFDQIDTFKLLRATTFLASNSSLSAGSAVTIVAGTVDDNIEATVWRVTVYWNHGSTNRSLQIWHCYSTTAANLNVVKDVEALGSGAGGTLTWTSGDAGGIKWTNNHSSQSADVKASALKIQSGNDF